MAQGGFIDFESALPKEIGKVAVSIFNILLLGGLPIIFQVIGWATEDDGGRH